MKSKYKESRRKTTKRKTEINEIENRQTKGNKVSIWLWKINNKIGTSYLQIAKLKKKKEISGTKKKEVLIIDHKEIKSIARNYYYRFEETEFITNTFPIKKYQSLMSLLVNSIEHSRNKYTTHKN